MMDNGLRGVALVCGARPLPGELREVELPGARLVGGELTRDRLTVRDVRGDVWLRDGRVPAPERDGGPGGGPGQEAANRAFGVFNATWHLARGLDALTVLLGARLPPLAVRIG
ncbi:MAG: hypothetical protein ACRDZO_15370, partial [Egibacteraceae bacterium]